MSQIKSLTYSKQSSKYTKLWIKTTCTILVCLSVFLSGCTNQINLSNKSNANNDQQNLSKGITIKKYFINGKSISITNIDPKIQTFEIFENNKEENKRLSIEEVRQKTQSDFAFNGNFFTPEFKPTGLLISEGKKLFPLIKAKLLEGVFTINQNNLPQLFTFEDFKSRQDFLAPNIKFAIQNGPILIDEQGQIRLTNQSSLKRSSRTAIGLTQDNHIAIIILKQSLFDSENSLSLLDFAKLLKESPELQDLRLHSVLNLDGGTSTGLSTSQEYQPELEKVENIIYTKKLSHD